MTHPDSGAVEVVPATKAQRPLIEGLMQLYFHDFSELEPTGSPDMEVDERGTFGSYPRIADYWREAGRIALIIRVGGHPAGFALINTLSHQGGTVERNMAEFFLVRKHRRRGLAREAVRLILAMYPGQWEVAVADRNAAAKAFWPRAVAEAPNVSNLNRLDGDGVRWRGPIWTFHAAPPRSTKARSP